MVPIDKVKDIIIRHDALEKELASGNIDSKLFAKKSKEYSSLGNIILIAKKYVNFENEKNETAAIFETILGHIDLSKRKIVNFPEDKLKNLINVSESQRKESNLSFEVKLFIKDIDE